MQQASEGIILTELLERLDSQLTYGGARRTSEYEADLLNQIDEICDAQIKIQRDLGYAQRNTKNSQENLKKTDDAIDKYCSETTRDKILLARGFQFMPEKAREIEDAPSDNDRIDLLEKENNALKNENQDLKEKFIRIRTFITKRCSKIPILGRILIKAMRDELGENQLSQPTSKGGR